MAWQLLTLYSNTPAVRALVDKYDFYILPIVNPDGKLTHGFLDSVPI